jgi:uncharacterized integral membrane protein
MEGIMWIVKWILSALLILFLLLFAFQNQSEEVSVEFINWQSHNLPLYIFLYIAFGLGLVFWLIVSAVSTIKLKGEIHQLQKDNRKIRQELDRLRNVSIEDVADEEKPEEVQEQPDSDKTI